MDAVSLPHTTVTLVVRLTLATVLGAAVGVNRELRLKPAGLRTHALVALGSAAFAIVGMLLTPSLGDLNAASRIVQGIVAGIGFIGGGAILRRDDQKGVQGISTAASIWVVAAVGVAAGFGLWRAAVASAALALVVLTFGQPLDRKLRQWGEDQPPDD